MKYKITIFNKTSETFSGSFDYSQCYYSDETPYILTLESTILKIGPCEQEMPDGSIKKFSDVCFNLDYISKYTCEEI